MRTSTYWASATAVLVLLGLTRDASAHSWSSVAIPVTASDGTAGPTSIAKAVPVGTAYNAVTLAPYYGSGGTFRLSLLSNVTNSNHNYAYWEFNYSSSGSHWTDTDSCGDTADYWGISSDGQGDVFAWAKSTDSGKIGEIPKATRCWSNDIWEGYQNVAATSASNIFLTSLSHNCTATASDGPCVYNSTGGTPAAYHSQGGQQITVDSTTGAIYTIDQANLLVYKISGSTATLEGSEICGPEDYSAVQIAAKDGVIYMLGDNGGDPGTVYWYEPGSSTCWNVVGTKTNFALSIATDNNTSSGWDVWATDADNNIWLACSATDSCPPPQALSGACQDGSCPAAATSLPCAPNLTCDEQTCTSDAECRSGYCNTYLGADKCVAGVSCTVPVSSSSYNSTAATEIMDIVTLGSGTTDATGTYDSNSGSQRAGLDTCGTGESTDPTGQVHESCCRSLAIPPSTLAATGDPLGTRVDKYEVTAGRMRQFIEAVNIEMLGKDEGYPPYDVYDWLLEEQSSDSATWQRLEAQLPTTTDITTISEWLALFPRDYTNDLNAIDQLGGDSIDTNVPSAKQGCSVGVSYYGASTYWWPYDRTVTANGGLDYYSVGLAQASGNSRPFTQDYYDVKPMNCTPYWLAAAFCAWDGGRLATSAELEALWGAQAYPWDSSGVNTFLPADPGSEGLAPTYTNASGAPSNIPQPVVQYTVNWSNDNSNGAQYSGLFYYYPNGGSLDTPPLAIDGGLDLSPYIAAPGRFFLDRTYATSATYPGAQGWQDMGANVMEVTALPPTPTDSGYTFCDCSGWSSLSAPSCTVSSECTSPAICQNSQCVVSCTCAGGTPNGFEQVAHMPETVWNGGSWEGHEAAIVDDVLQPPYVAKAAFSIAVQAQYAPAGFRCARSPEY
jgi:hypothetical protein